MSSFHHHPASFRDPSGFVFQANGKFYRQVNKSYAQDYDLLISSGLYQRLVDKNLLVEHEESAEIDVQSDSHYKLLVPRQLSFISYPYEWSFDQLKDAALLTLKILRLAITDGMILKDATPFNIQFENGNPVFIDTLSFEKYDPDQPWIAYRQFCECFLFPLYLEYYLNADLQKLLSIYIDGIPAAVTSKLLPMKSGFNLSIWLHVYLQNNIKSDGRGESGRQQVFDKRKLLHLAEHLESIINKFTRKEKADTTWSNYYQETILSRDYLSAKEKIFRLLIQDISYKTALDIGANEGYFTQILAEKDACVIAIDFDSRCINNLYNTAKKKKLGNILPLCIDITNPSPAIGFLNSERQSFTERVRSELVIALAVVHHLVLSKNIPLEDIARLMHTHTEHYLVIEFVPLEDPKSRELVKNKSQFHQPYDAINFEKIFEPLFVIEKKEIIPGTGRILYLMKKQTL